MITMFANPAIIGLSVPFAPLLAVVSLWYSVPLIVSVSLVCAATRHEQMGPILNHALRFGMWIVVFMAVVMGMLTFLEALA